MIKKKKIPSIREFDNHDFGRSRMEVKWFFNGVITYLTP